MNATDLCFTPATELVTMIRAKQLSPVELTRAVLERIERVNPTLNAFCTLTADTALARARDAEAAVMRGGPLGPLHGIPYSIKDLAFTRGVRTMSGSHIFATRVPDVDAPFVRRLAAAGGVMLGKTTSPEFGWKALGDSPLTGIIVVLWRVRPEAIVRTRPDVADLQQRLRHAQWPDDAYRRRCRVDALGDGGARRLGQERARRAAR